MSMNVEAEIRDLKRRVSEIEGSFGFLTQQVQSVHKDLLAFQEKTEQRFDKIDGRFDKVDGRLDHLDRGLRDLHAEMPKIVGDALSDYEIKQKRKS
jgi:tetrahydromethanopterin S-methyltransferase subunit G